MKLLMKHMAAWSFLLTLVFLLLYEWAQIPLFLTLAVTFGTTAYHFVMRLLVGYAIHCRFHNAVDPSLPLFRPLAFEAGIYRWLKVGKWKHLVPTYDSSFFSLKLHTADEIIGTMCQAELVHWIIILLSFLPLAAVGVFDAFWAFFITSLAAALFDLVFVILQRHNRPRVQRIALLMKQKRPQI